MAKILHVDDDQQLRALLRAVLQVKGHEVVSAENGREGFARFQEQPFDVVVSDVQMPVMDGLQLLEAIMRERDDTPVIMATSIDAIKTALNALKAGAFDYVLKPFKVPTIVETIERALESDALHAGLPSEPAMADAYALPETIAVSEGMLSTCDLVRRFAPLQTPHLIAGEAGTGRRLLARAMHTLSTRSEGPFIRCACQRLASGQLDQPFLSMDRSAGNTGRPLGGLLMDASEGTLVLEDVEALPLEYQDILLHVIQDGIIRYGGVRIPCDIRVLATTRKDLRGLVEHGTMREEFVALLTRMPIVTVPLRDRVKDILPLTWHVLLRLAEDRNAVPRIAHGARAALEHYAWPGNAGELVAVIEHTFHHSSGGAIDIGHFPDRIVESLEELNIGQLASDDDTQRGQVFREHLAERLADQLQDGSAPPARTHLGHQQAQPATQPADAMQPTEGTPGTYVLPDPVASEASSEPTPAASRRGRKRSRSRAAAAKRKSPRPKASTRKKKAPGKPERFTTRLRTAFRILLGRE